MKDKLIEQLEADFKDYSERNDPSKFSTKQDKDFANSKLKGLKMGMEDLRGFINAGKSLDTLGITVIANKKNLIKKRSESASGIDNSFETGKILMYESFERIFKVLMSQEAGK